VGRATGELPACGPLAGQSAGAGQRIPGILGVPGILDAQENQSLSDARHGRRFGRRCEVVVWFDHDQSSSRETRRAASAA
jgi:hypothetical protein